MGGRSRSPTIIGEVTFSIITSNPTLSKTKRMTVPSTKSGTASFRYHSILAMVLIIIFLNWGIRSGGISMMKSTSSPRINFAARNPTTTITAKMNTIHTPVAIIPRLPSIPRTTPSCAEQGMPSARSRVIISRSFFVSRMRVVRVAIVSQPSPRMRGRTALPLQPIFLKTLSTITASLGRYPESSIIPKPIKNVPTIGNIMARE